MELVQTIIPSETITWKNDAHWGCVHEEKASAMNLRLYFNVSLTVRCVGRLGSVALSSRHWQSDAELKQ